MKVSLLTADDLIWKADGGSAGGAEIMLGTLNVSARTFAVDPYPAYTHDIALVEELAASCCEAFPLTGSPTELYVCSHEFASRFNGLTYESALYRQKVKIAKPDGTEVDGYGHAHTIGISGKRTPRMPAQTRYLVTHEYGHAAFNQTRRLLGYGEHEDDKLETEYLRIRGGDIPYVKKGRGAYRWHQLASEIVANDFRIAVMNTEPDFWPHDALPPTDSIREWWAQANDLTRKADRIVKEAVAP